MTSEALDNPTAHAVFLFTFVVSMLTLFLIAFCDPGICTTETKDGLKPVRTMLQRVLREIVPYMSNFLYRLSKTLFGKNTWMHFV